mmetsp:Transcript_83751/g.249967  ORF Transcript_83751/g.249967 Transcript_83751/m.249967 type:complete len:252 (+) Transcript_83751:569-1324(+)
MAQLLTGIVNGVDTHVDDDAAGLQPSSPDKLWLAYGGNQNVCSPHMLLHVLGARVADCDGGVHRLKEHCHGHANYVGAAQNHHVLPFDIHTLALQQLNAARRGAGNRQGRVATPEAEVANVHGGKSIRIFLHLDLLQHQGLINVARQRELHEDCMDPGVCVEPSHLCEKLCLADAIGESNVHAMEVGLHGSLLLHPDIRLRVLALANQDHRQTRLQTVFLLELLCFCPYLCSDLRRNVLSIDKLCFLGADR